MVLQLSGLILEVFSVCLLFWVLVRRESTSTRLWYCDVVFWTVCPFILVCLHDVVVSLDRISVPNGRWPRHGSVSVETRASLSLIFTQARSTCVASISRESFLTTVILWIQLLSLFLREKIECRVRLYHSLFASTTGYVAPRLTISTVPTIPTVPAATATIALTTTTSSLSVLVVWLAIFLINS